MKKITILDLFKAKAHIGHLKKFISPKALIYIYTINNNLSIINLNITILMLKKTIIFIKKIINKKGKILFVNTKKQFNWIIKKYATIMNMPYINNRWLGGILTNYKTIKKSINYYTSIKNKINNKNFKILKKKEKKKILKKYKKLKLNLDGIKNMKSLPKALFVIDIKKEKNSILEAKKSLIPIIAILDTDENPININYIIPGNNDSLESINFYLKNIYNNIQLSHNGKKNI